MHPAVFLDRDNTLIANDGDLGDPARVALQEGVPDALRSLRAAGYRLVVVTNQGGVARGAFTESDVDRVHQRIAEIVDESIGVTGLIDRFYYCPFHPEGTVAEYRREHSWRKPQPGMIIQAARDMDLALEKSWMVGDQVRDIQAGKKAGCRTILISRDAETIDRAKPTAVASTISDAVSIILERRESAAAASSSTTRTSTASSAVGNGRSASSTSGAATATAARTGSTAPAPVPMDSPSPAPVSESAPLPSARDVAGRPAKEETEPLRRAVLELAEEIRSERLRRSEFTPLRMAAGVGQLMVILLVLLAVFFMPGEDFFKWMAGAVLLQLSVIALLLMDQRG